MTSLPRSLVIAVVAIAITSASSLAQAPQSPLVTRTIMLRNLRAPDAARLVSPYVRHPQAGVFEAGSVQAITVIETEPVLARIDSLIRENDRTPAVLTFRFQLIAADDTPGPRDPAIESLDATLRGLFRYKGYHLLGEGSTSAAESENFSLTVAAGEGRYALHGEVLAAQAVTGGAVRLRVRLASASIRMTDGKPLEGESLLSTGLTVPLGQTVILGSAAPGGANQALILAVRPEVAIPPRR